MSKIFPVKKIAEIDKYSIEHEPILSINLMERAAHALFDWIIKNFHRRSVKLFIGPGNNGGDGLALARILLLNDWDVSVYLVNSKGIFSEDAQLNLDRLRVFSNISIVNLDLKKENWPRFTADDLIVDGLFGSGLTRPLNDLPKEVVKHINACGGTIISIDIPSGLMGEDNRMNDLDAIVKAHYTLTLQFPKLSFLIAENHQFVGEWYCLPIGLHPKAIEKSEALGRLIDHSLAKSLIKKRNRFSHKGHFGHALLIAGGYGKMGAAVLASRGCLKAGAGLLTAHIPHWGYPVMQTAVPEAMVSIDRSDVLISEYPELSPYDAVGMGPGIGQKPNTKRVLELLVKENKQKPMVLDADAINILSQCKDLIKELPETTILTPHPGEFDRLTTPSGSGYERYLKLMAFVEEYRVIVVLKGAYTIVAGPGRQCYFNTSGNPGMATAGSGDVLTGIILGLLCQGYSSVEAAILGVYIHGVAGDVAAEKEGYEGLIAGDIIQNLGAGFRCLRT
ncbi:NAD(P)H-hydrate dehydratase [Marinilabiliaceae bacterium JC017]|nr:NAD(P)H-hydrate dehydratase [Marinilabiliaceae bacterium JC017]